MEISLAFAGFLALLGALAVAARSRCMVRPLGVDRVETAGEPGFLRRLAS